MKKGFTLLFSVLVTSLLLAIALSIIGLSTKHSLISAFGRESQVAFYSADSGLECVRYWDQSPSERDAFSTSSPKSAITCFGVSIPVIDRTSADGSSCEHISGTCRKFKVAFSLVPNVTGNPDGDVYVEKNTLTSETTIDSRGRNTDISGPRRLERAVKLTYTPPRKANQCPVGDVMLLVDVSGSLDNTELATLKNTIKNTIVPSLYGLAPYNRLGIIFFGSTALTAVHLSDQTNQQAILDAVDDARSGINVGVDTNTVLAFRYAINEFTDKVDSNMNSSTHVVNSQPAGPYDRSDYQNVVFLLTDGGNDSYIDEAGTHFGTPQMFKNNVCNDFTTSAGCSGGSPVTSSDLRTEVDNLKNGPTQASVFTLGIGTTGQLCHDGQTAINCTNFLKNFIATTPAYAQDIATFNQAEFNAAIERITECPQGTGN